MTKRKKITLLISILVFILLIVATSLIILYLNTDMFKSNQTLFFKYLGKNKEIIKQIEKISETTEYEKKLENSKYIENIEMKVNYTEDYGTTLENTSNSINDLKLTIEGQVDNVNKYNYKDVKLLKNEEQILEIEYVQSDDTYGIRFSDLFRQYILVENNNLKELFKNFGYSEQDIENLPDSIDVNQVEIINSIKFSDEEIEILKEKYFNIISKNVAKENFQKESNLAISINERDFIVNAYILKLTNEQLNNIYINILENLKEEEIVLSKIDKMQNYIAKVNVASLYDVHLKEKFANKIENIIEEINKTNIGIEETKIIVYESQGNTVRTIVKGLDYQINLDTIIIEQEIFLELILEENKKQKQTITLKDNNNKISINVEKQENDKQSIVSFEKNEKNEGSKCIKNINIKYEDDTNKLEANIIDDIKKVKKFEKVTVFNEENSIKLNDLSEEKLKIILNKLNKNVKLKLDSISHEIKIDEIQNMLIDMNIIKNKKILEGEGISETEKNRFNSKFEILTGENIDSENMLKILEVIKENLINIEVISTEKLSVEINKNRKNEDMSAILENFIKKYKNKKYNVSIEYDNESGLIKYIVLTFSK